MTKPIPSISWAEKCSERKVSIADVCLFWGCAGERTYPSVSRHTPPLPGSAAPMTRITPKERLVSELSVIIAALDNLKRRAGAVVLALGEDLSDDNGTTMIIAQLRATCVERRHSVTGDGWTTERAAADLIGVAPSTLRGWRDHGGGLAWRKLHNGMVQYSLVSLAEYLAALPQNTAETR
jgi:hypothetical protein